MLLLTGVLVLAATACNQLLGIEGARVGCLSDDHCGARESCLERVCAALRSDASDAGYDAGFDATNEAAR